MVEMLHVVRARRLEIQQDGNLTAELVEGVKVERDTGAACYRDEMDKTVCGTADRL